MFMDPRSIPGTIEGMRSIISDQWPVISYQW
jgi:hypothetical protein